MGKEQGTDGKLTMLADGSAAFTKAIGLELDLVGRGMGTRSQRYALIAQDGKVTHLAVEQPGGFEVSTAESINPGQPLILRPIACGAAKGATSLRPAGVLLSCVVGRLAGRHLGPEPVAGVASDDQMRPLSVAQCHLLRKSRYSGASHWPGRSPRGSVGGD